MYLHTCLPIYPPICLPIYLCFYKSIVLMERRRRKNTRSSMAYKNCPKKSSHMERQGEIMLYDLVLGFRKFAKTWKTRIKVLPIVSIGWYLSEQGKLFKIREGLEKQYVPLQNKGIINWKQGVCSL